MSYSLSIRKKAQKDIENAYNWYEDQLSGLGERFLQELEDCYLRLERNPYAFANINNELRQIGVHKFPFVIVFEINAKKVIIYAVFHTNRDSKNKYSN